MGGQGSGFLILGEPLKGGYGGSIGEKRYIYGLGVSKNWGIFFGGPNKKDLAVGSFPK